MFLLLLCNDRDVLGPWVNGRKTNLLTAAIVAGLVLLSIVLTASVLFPSIGATAILGIFGGGVAVAIAAGVGLAVWRRGGPRVPPVDRTGRSSWRMPPLGALSRPAMSTGRRLGLTVLRGYLLIAVGLVIVRVIQLAVTPR